MAGAKSFGEFHYTKVSVKEAGKIAAKGRHNERGRETPNADPTRSHENVRLAGSGDWLADVQARADEATFRRANSVLALDVAFFVSKGFFDDKPPAVMDEWARRTMAWMAQEFGGEKNVVAAILHKDETTPHIQAMIVPLDEKDRLNARHFIGQPRQVVALHTSYNQAVADLGLERGVQGSVATHSNIREWYAKIETPTPAPEIARQHLEVERPGRFVGNPDRWAADQTERIAEWIAPTLDAALVKAQHYEQQAAKAEANIVVMQGHIRDLRQERDALREDYRALAAQVRAIDLPTVIERLGGQVDRYNPHKWRVAGEHISITGERFYNHDRQQGGGGAIDLVMHAAGYDYREAVAYLRDTHGADAAVTAATWRQAREAQREAQEIVRHAERAPVLVPDMDEDRWPQVRAYLTEERGLPRHLIDALHKDHLIYADSRANAVFLRVDDNRLITGASLRGTLPGSEFKGLAPGSRRDEGHFAFTIGTPEQSMTPQYYITESAIDAVSRAALLAQTDERGVHVFISTDGHGELPRRWIDDGLERHGLIHCGFDNDRGGDTLWTRVQEAYPRAEQIVRERPPGGVKDWNDALRAARERQEEQDRQRETERTRDRRQDRGQDRDRDRGRGGGRSR